VIHVRNGYETGAHAAQAVRRQDGASAGQAVGAQIRFQRPPPVPVQHLLREACVKTPTADELDAMHRLAARPEGATMKGYLQGTLDDINQRLAMTEDAVKLRILQGQAQVVRALLAAWHP